MRNGRRLNDTAAEWDDDRDPTPKEQAEEDAWIAANSDEIRAQVQAASAPGRPSYSAREVFDELRAHIDGLFAARDAQA